MKIQIDHSFREYDGALLTWHRIMMPKEHDYGFWFLVLVTP